MDSPVLMKGQLYLRFHPFGITEIYLVGSWQQGIERGEESLKENHDPLNQTSRAQHNLPNNM